MGVNHLAQVRLARPPLRPVARHKRRDRRPFPIAHIACVARTPPVMLPASRFGPRHSCFRLVRQPDGVTTCWSRSTLSGAGSETDVACRIRAARVGLSSDFRQRFVGLLSAIRRTFVGVASGFRAARVGPACRARRPFVRATSDGAVPDRSGFGGSRSVREDDAGCLTAGCGAGRRTPRAPPAAALARPPACAPPCFASDAGSRRASLPRSSPASVRVRRRV